MKVHPSLSGLVRMPDIGLFCVWLCVFHVACVSTVESPRVTRRPQTWGSPGYRTWRRSTTSRSATRSRPCAWCTPPPWWPSTWACWRTTSTCLWAASPSRWAPVLSLGIRAGAGAGATYSLWRDGYKAVGVALMPYYNCSDLERYINLFYIHSFSYTHYTHPLCQPFLPIASSSLE